MRKIINISLLFCLCFSFPNALTAQEENKVFRDSLDGAFDINKWLFDLKNSGIGLIGEYETFNNVLSPSKGIRIHLSYSQSLEFLGSDRNSGRLIFFTLAYIPILLRWNTGLRIESIFATTNTPFYLLPYINLTGVPILRYQSEMTLLAETEQFVNIYKRWSLVGYGGIGTTMPTYEDKSFSKAAWNAGGGSRFLIARNLGLQMGKDIARGPEDWAFYIVFGSAWLK